MVPTLFVLAWLRPMAQPLAAQRPAPAMGLQFSEMRALDSRLDKIPMAQPLAARRPASALRAAPAMGLQFSEMRALDSRLDKICRTGADAVSGFFDQSASSFAITPGAPRFSVTSSVFALLAIDSDASAWATPDRPSAELVVRALLEAEWRANDVFQSALVVVASRLIDPGAAHLSASETAQVKFAAAVEEMLAARPRRRSGRTQRLSAYSRYWMARATTMLLNPACVGASTAEAAPFFHPALPPLALPSAGEKAGEEAVMLALQRSCEVAFDDVCRQLAYHAAGDTSLFDVVILSYSLLTYVHITNALLGYVPALDVDPAAGSARDRDGINGAGSALPSYNPKLVVAALDAVFGQMSDNGLWPSGQPIFTTRGSGNNVGNAFVFSPDLLASLVETMPAEALRPHLPRVAAHMHWLETHIREEMLPTGQMLRGWRSNHLPPEGGPLGWCTSQAVRCAGRTRSLVRALLCADVLASLGGRPRARPDERPWARLLDSDLPGQGADGSVPPTLKSTVDTKMLSPLLALAAADPLGRTTGPADEAPPPFAALEGAASYSAIFFGPPGTAKTTVVAAIAAKLGWGFVTIDTSTFLADGLANVAARISVVFEQLMQLSDVVVLFDEVEEFALDRTNPALTMESRMLTTAMLTKLADLRGARRVAFFIATNRLAALDAAVVRPGRFDLQLFVGTPNLNARMGRFHVRLGAMGLAEPAAASAAAAFEAVLARRWESDALFLTYLETEKLAADAAARAVAAAAGADAATLGQSFERHFEALLDSQAAVMTVRGTVRDEFVDSMRMSRV